MCLILFAYRMHPAYPLIVAANRDEFHARPTAPSGWWEDAPEVLAGRDLRAGGTWMGITRQGRFAAVTNLRNPELEQLDALSRGALVADFLRGNQAPSAYLEQVQQQANRFNGFNLLVADPTGLWYLSSRAPGVRTVDPGVRGLSNAPLGVAWPKTQRGERALAALLADADPKPEAILEVLADRTVAQASELPDTRVGPERERLLAPAFIMSPVYGTRASTVLLMTGSGAITWVERTFHPDGSTAGEARFNV